MIYSQFFTNKIFISGGFSSVLILAYNHTQFEDQENMRENNVIVEKDRNILLLKR
jgi:hypothetical protein